MPGTIPSYLLETMPTNAQLQKQIADLTAELKLLKHQWAEFLKTWQDTGKFRQNMKDQYFTKKSIAEQCVAKIHEVIEDSNTYQWVEPSAGNGIFLNCLTANTDAIGIDLDPKGPNILKGNFMDWSPETKKKRIFFGNPPFGRQGSFAKAFIKHAAVYADVIAFILPRSFVKPSMSRAFPLTFHCVYSEELAKNSFEVNGDSYDVPCVFQIWQKKDSDRILAAKIAPVGFDYVKHKEPFHIAFQRAGGNAGKCFPATSNSADYNPQFHYYLKLDERYVPHIKKILKMVNDHVFPSNTVGPRSLSKSEANEVLNRILASAASI